MVSQVKIPSSVVLKEENSDDPKSSNKLFDLTELVRDCNRDLDLPKEPTPASMVGEGLQLHAYQQASLRWMIDKEKESSDMGETTKI